MIELTRRLISSGCQYVRLVRSCSLVGSELSDRLVEQDVILDRYLMSRAVCRNMQADSERQTLICTQTGREASSTF